MNLEYVAGHAATSGCRVAAQDPPDMTLAVEAGTVVTVTGDQIVVAPVDITIPAGSATYPRFDLVVVDRFGVASVVAGTESYDPRPPDPGGSAVAVLATVFVPPAAAAITNAHLIDKRLPT